MKTEKHKNTLKYLQENNIIKNVKKCLLTVLITYASLCAVACGSLYFLMNSDAGDFLTFISAIIISAGSSAIGIHLGKRQKCIWVPFVLTVLCAWFLPRLLYLIFDNHMGISTQITQAVNILSVVLGYPGVGFGMASGEHGITISNFTYNAFFTLCGIVPPAITVFSAKFRK